MNNTERPLSPHLSIYRWPISMTLSILHRAAGVAMSFGLIALAYWLIAVRTGGADYQQAVALMTSRLGWICLIGWSFAFFLHLANGVRHLFCNIGWGFNLRQANASAWFVLIFAFSMTALFWVLL